MNLRRPLNLFNLIFQKYFFIYFGIPSNTLSLAHYMCYICRYLHTNLSTTNPMVGPIIFLDNCSRSDLRRFNNVLFPALFRPTNSTRAFRRRGVRPKIPSILVSLRQMFIVFHHVYIFGPDRRQQLTRYTFIQNSFGRH